MCLSVNEITQELFDMISAFEHNIVQYSRISQTNLGLVRQRSRSPNHFYGFFIFTTIKTFRYYNQDLVYTRKIK